MPRPFSFQTAALFLAPLLAVLGFTRPAAALYAEIDLEEVPIDRLVANLQRRAAENPKDAETQHQLARIHAMAYTSKRDTLIVVPGSGELWSQHTHVPFLAQCHKGPPKDLVAPAPQVVPLDGAAPPPPQPAPPPPAERWRGSHRGGEPKVQTTDDPKKQAAAKEHLEKAIAHYKQALELAPDNLTAALGHAWALDQNGDKEAAMAGYRSVIKLGWEQEQKLLPKKEPGGGVILGGVGPDWQSITSEAAGYLLPHLDAAKDAAEIATLKDRVAKLMQVNRAVTPLVIPLIAESKIEELVDPAARVPFDADGSGIRRTWTWITPKAGWLVIDRKQSGRVRSALQMFGNVSYWCFWRNGYEALSALDDNGNGELAGEELRDLAVWHDANSNGVSDPGEVKSLAAWGIVALSCRSTSAPAESRNIYCALSPTGVRFHDGRVWATYDVLLRQQ